MDLDLSPRRQFGLQRFQAAAGRNRLATAGRKLWAKPEIWRWGGTANGPLRRLILYGLALLVAGGLVIWSAGRVEAISDGAAFEASQTMSVTEQQLTDVLVSSQVSAIDLAARGYKALAANPPADGQLLGASIFLQAASIKDPKYRDAAVFAGFALLKRADANWSNDAAGATRLTKSALRYLELARSIDPIHGYTFQLLDIAYTNLGQVDLAAEANKKAQAFSISNS